MKSRFRNKLYLTLSISLFIPSIALAGPYTIADAGGSTGTSTVNTYTMGPAGPKIPQVAPGVQESPNPGSPISSNPPTTAIEVYNQIVIPFNATNPKGIEGINPVNYDPS